MTFEVQTAATFDAADSIFDFSRRAPAPAQLLPGTGRGTMTRSGVMEGAHAPAANDTLPGADRPDPEPGWATRNPDRAMLFLFVTPRDCAAVDELLAL